tara:strand:- start:1526 stop:2443 length:918 start_codon:yes stop_codon:yes gene_type:complete
MIKYFSIFLLLIGCSGENPNFNEESAFDYLIKQCDFGPRNPGSKGYYECRDFIVNELKKSTNEVILQDFIHNSEEKFNLQNIIARFNPDASFQTIISCHWDTRPIADHDLNPNNHDKPIIGANDGASGVAVLLELAKIMAMKPPLIGVSLVFFDGEDMGIPGENETYCLGSQYFSKNLPIKNIAEAINLDMVGDKQLQLPIERYSYQFHPDLVRYLWSRAKEMKLEAFEDRLEYAIYDDHVPLNKYANIPSIDLIDFRYPNTYKNYWHTLDDLPENCSSKSLGQVGRLMVDYIYNRKNQNWNKLR